MFSPDGLAGKGLAGAPSLGELGDEEQSAATLVEDAGLAQVGCGAAGIRDLADEGVVLDQSQLDGVTAVTDGIGDQFA
nr:hypothetical protein [Frankia sp. Cppng1_Ct_nod]